MIARKMVQGGTSSPDLAGGAAVVSSAAEPTSQTSAQSEIVAAPPQRRIPQQGPPSIVPAAMRKHKKVLLVFCAVAASLVFASLIGGSAAVSTYSGLNPTGRGGENGGGGGALSEEEEFMSRPSMLFPPRVSADNVPFPMSEGARVWLEWFEASFPESSSFAVWRNHVGFPVKPELTYDDYWPAIRRVMKTVRWTGDESDGIVGVSFENGTSLLIPSIGSSRDIVWSRWHLFGKVKSILAKRNNFAIFYFRVNDEDLYGALRFSDPHKIIILKALALELPLYFPHWSPAVDKTTGNLMFGTIPIPHDFTANFVPVTPLEQYKTLSAKVRAQEQASDESDKQQPANMFARVEAAMLRNAKEELLVGSDVTHDSPLFWSKKRKVAVWRGGPNGHDKSPPGLGCRLLRLISWGWDPRFAQHDRYRMVAELQGSPHADAGFSKRGNKPSWLLPKSMVKGSLSLPEQEHYALQLDVDGFTSAWEGLRWKLCHAASPVLKIHSSGQYVQWYYRFLKEGHHLFMGNLSDAGDLKKKKRSALERTIQKILLTSDDNKDEAGAIGDSTQQSGPMEKAELMMMRSRLFCRMFLTTDAADGYLHYALLGGADDFLRSQDWRIQPESSSTESGRARA